MNPLHLALAVLVVFVWGGAFLVIKLGLQDIPPFLFCFLRFFLTSIPAVFFIKFPAAPRKMVILYGLFMFALQFSLLFMGMYLGVTPGLASLLMQTHVFFTSVLAVCFFGDKISSWQIGGALVSFSGIALVGINTGGSLTLPGLLLVIAAAASWGIGNVISKKMGRVNMVALVIWGSLVAWPPLLVLSLIFHGPMSMLASLQNISLLSLGSVAYITYISTLFGFGVWSFLLHHYRLPTIVPFTLLVPIVAIVSSALVFGETLQPWKILAGFLVIAGLCINILGPRFFRPKKS